MTDLLHQITNALLMRFEANLKIIRRYRTRTEAREAGRNILRLHNLHVVPERGSDGWHLRAVKIRPAKEQRMFAEFCRLTEEKWRNPWPN